MRIRITLLFVFALVPFVIQLRFIESTSYNWIPGGGFTFYFLTGLAWCLLFAYTYYGTSGRLRKKLLWLLPLLLFATGGPAFYILLGVGFWIQSLRGVAPP